jgi:uncharacterized protein YuzE
MEIRYDPRYNIAYIRFRKKNSELEIIPLTDDIFVDLSADGKISCIELFNARKQLEGMDEGRLIVKDLSTGKSVELRKTRGSFIPPKGS